MTTQKMFETNSTSCAPTTTTSKSYREDHGSAFGTLFNNPQFSDFCIVMTTENTRVNVWKGVLSIHSEFFKTLFSTNNQFTENVTNELILNDTNEEFFLFKLIQYFYTGVISYTNLEAIQLLHYAQKYMVVGNLSSQLRNDVESFISSSNSYQIFLQVISFLNPEDPFVTSILQKAVSEMGKIFDSILRNRASELLTLSPQSLIVMLKEMSQLCQRTVSPGLRTLKHYRRSTSSLNLTVTKMPSNPIVFLLNCDGKQFLRFLIDWMLFDCDVRKQYMSEIMALEQTLKYSR